MDTAIDITDNTIDKRMIFKRLINVRSRLIFYFPFFGSLLMRLKLSLADCQTAATDMERIIFDPRFVSSLSDEDIEFVMLHEVMHCALEHCTRGRGKIKKAYNIACDIVVNSNIIHEMRKAIGSGSHKILVGGEEPMHLAPNGIEGYYYTADQVYEMLLERKADPDYDSDILTSLLEESRLDDHGVWDTIPENSLLSDEWEQTLIKAVRSCEYGVPMGIRKLVDGYVHRSLLNWKAILHDFIQIVSDEHDYLFSKPDKRYLYGDIILPSFAETDTEKVENIWFLIDTSGSVSGRTLTALFGEMRSAIEQVGNLSGKLSFFDDTVTEPQDFNDADSIVKITPKGGGGTSFKNIFDYMKENMQDDLPKAVIVLTDGLCSYPDEEAAMGIPVLWILINNTDEAPWGTTIHIEESE